MAEPEVVQYWPYLLGPLLGLGAFAIGFVTLENVLWRSDDQGRIKLRLDNLVEYIKLPFDTNHWEQNWALLPNIPFTSRLKLLNLNWVAMVGLGALGSLGTYFVLNKM